MVIFEPGTNEKSQNVEKNLWSFLSQIEIEKKNEGRLDLKPDSGHKPPCYARSRINMPKKNNNTKLLVVF